MNLRVDLFRPAVAIISLALAPAAVSAQEWVARGVCTATDLEAVDFSDAENGFAVGQNYILHSGDSGSSWAPALQVSRSLHDVEFEGAALGLVVGDGGLILRTTDGGLSWNEVESPTASDLHTVALSDGGAAFAAGFGVALRSTDSGATWSLVDAGDIRFLGSAANGLDRAWLVGERGIVRGTTDGGFTWASQSSGTTADLRGAFFVSASRGWIAGAGSTLLFTDDGGATWLPRSAGLDASLNALHFVSQSTGWVVGSQGAIYRTEDAGLSWVAESAASADELLDVSFSAGGQGCAVGIVCTVLLRANPVAVVADERGPNRLLVRPASNPVRAAATIQFAVPTDGLVRLRVVDAQGRLVANLVEGRLPAGWHEARWDAGSVAAGIYVARLEAGGARAVRKFVLSR